MDSDDAPDPATPEATPDAPEAGDTTGDQSEAAPAEDDEANAGAAPTSDDHPPAADAYGHADDLVGDWAVPDIDLDWLVTEDDGEGTDDEGGGQ